MKIEKLEELANSLEEGRVNLCQWAWVPPKGPPRKDDDICYARLSRGEYSLDKMGFFSLYLGETKAEWYNTKGLNSRIPPDSKRTKGPRSMMWVSYLLEDSPWREVTKHLAIKDVNWIDRYGFFFDDMSKVPAGLFTNFLIATRFCFEFPSAIKRWEEWMLDGVDPHLALYMAVNYYETLGRWDMFSADAHTFFGGLEIAHPRFRRFVTKTPTPRALDVGKNTGSFRVMSSDIIWGSNVERPWNYVQPKALSGPELLTLLTKELEKPCESTS